MNKRCTIVMRVAGRDVQCSKVAYRPDDDPRCPRHGGPQNDAPRHSMAVKPVGVLDRATGHICYYGVAENAHGQIELLYVTRLGGRQVSQEWQGVTYKTMRQADKHMGVLNFTNVQR